ncbi:MAG: ATP-binding protein [Azospirillum brasilense]|nr:MAG: ATP-binding protein [Azospirillum brasilense]
MATPAPQHPTTTSPLFPHGACLLGQGSSPQYLTLSRANRHGLVAGATGTGKTVTLQVLAEGFLAHGVPVFMADVKGDLSGIAASGGSEKARARAEKLQLQDYAPASMPTVFWDVFGTRGHALRMTISEVGPILLARLLDLSDAQEGVLAIAFQIADDQGLLLLDLEDLHSLLLHVGEQAKPYSAQYGNISAATVNAIQRKLLQLKQEGAEAMFGEPALDIHDLLRTAPDGRGIAHVLAAEQLIQRPRMYSIFLLWLLSELFENLPEIGDADKPKLVFFFDEAHLLFADAPKALLEKVEQMVRLIRSKGVGVYFVTQQPQDIPADVLAQLGNRVQHALRAFTPQEQKAVKVAASSFRPNPAVDVQAAITTLAVGEALVSTLQEDGTPTMVERTAIRPPISRMGPLSDAERQDVLRRDPIGDTYDTPLNRDSAHEMLQARKAAQAPQPVQQTAQQTTPRRSSGGRAAQSVTDQVVNAAVRQVTGQIGRSIGRQLLRGLLGGLTK